MKPNELRRSPAYFGAAIGNYCGDYEGQMDEEGSPHGLRFND